MTSVIIIFECSGIEEKFTVTILDAGLGYTFISNDLVEITNALGQTILSKKGNGSIGIDISDWPVGLYVVRYGALTKKLIVSH